MAIVVRILLSIAVAAVAVLIPLPAHAQLSDQLRMARAYEQAGDQRNAARIYVEAYERGEHSDVVFDGVVRTLTALQNYAALGPIAEAQFAERPSAQVALIAGRVAARRGLLEDADRWWERSIELMTEANRPAATVASHVAQIAADQEALRLSDRAIASYLKARQLQGSATAYALALADLYGAAGKIEASVREVLNDYREQGRIVIVYGRLSALLSRSGSSEIIESALEQASENAPDILEVQAWFYGEVGAWQKALDATQSLEKARQAQGRELLQFANRARTAGMYDVALRALDDVIASRGPLALSATYSYAQTLDQRMMQDSLLSQEDAVGIIERYRSIAREYPNNPLAAEALFRSAQLYDDVLQQTEEARSVLTFLTNRWNGTEAAAKGRLRLAELYLAVDRPDAAHDILHPLMSERSPASIADYKDLAALLLADIELFAGRVTTALQRYTELAGAPTSVAANDALERLGMLMQRSDDSVAVDRMVQALSAERRRRLDLAIALYDTTARSTRQPDLADQCRYAAAQMLARQRQDNRAQEMLEPVLARLPESIVGDRALFLAATILERQKRFNEAIDALTVILVQYPMSILAPSAREQIRRLRAES